MKIIILVLVCLGTFVPTWATEADKSPVVIPTKPVRKAHEKPNIIFIFADDFGYGDVGVHGSTFCKTPHIDRLAAEGIGFQDFRVNAPTCSQSRVSVMTGHFSSRYHMTSIFARAEANVKYGVPDFLDPKAPLVTRMMKDGGYATGHYGKWHLTGEFFDSSEIPMPDEYGIEEYGCHTIPGPNILKWESSQHAVEFIKRHKDEPFFLNLWLHETHLSHFPKPEYLDQFKHLNEQQQVYAAVVAEADAGVGRILDTLKDLGLDEKTLVLFSSDNGPENTWDKNREPEVEDIYHYDINVGLRGWYSVGETGGLRERKRSLRAGGTRVPFIARWPGKVPAGKVDRNSVLSAVDLLPTLVELAGRSLPDGYEPDGESIVNALMGKRFKRSTPVLCGRNMHTYALQIGNWRLIDYEKPELCDIETDWAEENDVASSHPEIVERLRKRIWEYRKTFPVEPDPACFASSTVAMRKAHKPEGGKP